MPAPYRNGWKMQCSWDKIKKELRSELGVGLRSRNRGGGGVPFLVERRKIRGRTKLKRLDKIKGRPLRGRKDRDYHGGGDASLPGSRSRESATAYLQKEGGITVSKLLWFATCALLMQREEWEKGRGGWGLVEASWVVEIETGPI